MNILYYKSFFQVTPTKKYIRNRKTQGHQALLDVQHSENKHFLL